MRKKLGLQTDEADDLQLIQSLLDWMEATRADFTNTFRELSHETLPPGNRYADPAFQSWFATWRQRLQRESVPVAEAFALMHSVNPSVIPRNHRVEEALAAAENGDDLSVLHRLLAVLARPFESNDENAEYQSPPPDDGAYRTFCGT
jgi:uncharacterized protein YdiU (UPF0061 family)